MPAPAAAAAAHDPRTAGATARLEVARAAAAEVAELAMGWYESPHLKVEEKPDGSPVTPVDKAGERILRRAVGHHFPNDAFLGEEEGETEGTSGWRWIVDPIDGTRSFATGLPTFGILIGIEHGAGTAGGTGATLAADEHGHGEVLAGLAVFPAVREAVEAVRGCGATWTTATGMKLACRVSDVARVEDATLDLASPRSFETYGHLDVRERLDRTARRLRGWDDGLGFSWVATGRVDGAVALGQNPWDVAAFMPVIEEAGGAITAWDGGDPRRGGRILAGSRGLVAALRREI